MFSNRNKLSTVWLAAWIIFGIVATVIGAEDTTTTTTATEADSAAQTPPPVVKPLEQPEQWQNDLVRWLIGKPNGYFSDKILWTKTEMGYNMHAAEDIPRDATLMVIPQAALITSDGTDEECVTIAKMMKEYERGESSEYYPYIRYLFGGFEGGTSPNLLPTTWSDPAKDLLKKMVGTELFPQKFDKGQRRVLAECQSFIDRKELEGMDKETASRWQDAFIYWLSRSWSDKMVPILDMINHRNGKWLNVESTTAHAGKDVRVYALRDIQKGEQLWSESRRIVEVWNDKGNVIVGCVYFVKVLCLLLTPCAILPSPFVASSQIRTTNVWTKTATTVKSSTVTSRRTF